MSQFRLDRLVVCLDPIARSALEKAALLAANFSHSTVEIAHWVKTLCEDRAAVALIEGCGVSVTAVSRETERALQDIPLASNAPLTLSQNVVQLAREAFLVAELSYDRRKISTGDLLTAMLDEPTLRIVLRGVAPSLLALDRTALEARLAERPEPGDTGDDRGANGATVPELAKTSQGSGRNEFLELYTQDLTASAREGRIDPVIGREAELRQVIDVLMRRRQNNPILIGEAGVGKTAIAEALALELVSDQVPERLAKVRLLSLDLGLLQAGAGVKGEFERRLRGVIDGVKASPEPIILFIDEAHMLMGAGPQAGQGEAANLLKPALARGELRTLAATTFGEYKRYIEKDAALTRRFQAIKVDEPTEDTAVAMLRGIADRFEAHHGVVIRHEALVAAVALSARYIPERQLPDKAISLVDTAAAAVAMARQGLPDAVRAARAEAGRLSTEADWLGREPASASGTQRLGAILARQSELGQIVADISLRHDQERRLVAEADRLDDLLAGVEPHAGDVVPAANVAAFPSPPAADAAQDRSSLRLALARAESRLKTVSGGDPLVPRIVDAEAIAAVVARWTGIPVGKLLADRSVTLERLAARLKERIVGQDAVLDRIAAVMRSALTGLSDPRRPPAVFFLVGQSGTGKTETALALADVLYGGPQQLTTINMSEFKEEHKVSMLLGSPPGYVGFGEGGVLTEAVRRRPFGVLLLDEMDKAHPGVQDIFYQLFDRGMLRDGEGRDVDFKNTTVVMTANSGSELLAQLAADTDAMPDLDGLESLLANELRAQFKPAFLGRTTILPYLPLSEAAIAVIVDLQIRKVERRVADRYGADLVLADEARNALVERARSSDTGARAIEAMIARDLLPVLSAVFIQSLIGGPKIAVLRVGYDEAGFSAEPSFREIDEFDDPVEASSNHATSDRAPRDPEGADSRQAFTT